MARKARTPRTTSKPLPPGWKVKWGPLFFTLGVAVLLGYSNWFAHLSTEERAGFGVAEMYLEKLGGLTASLTDDLGLTGHDAAIAYTEAVDNTPVPFGMPERAGAPAPDDVMVLRRKGYWVGFSPSCGHPVWAAYTLPTKIVASSLQRPATFEEDPDLKKMEVPNAPVDAYYRGSGYDRGHMAPNHAIATRYGKSAQLETFYFSNIVPQKPTLNREPWRILEHLVAEDFSALGDKLWVLVCTIPDEDPNQKLTAKKRKGYVRIPKGFGMIICGLHEGKLRAMAFYLPQETREDKSPRYCFTSIRALEERTGLNFFPKLSTLQQNDLETVEVNRYWPKWELVY